MLIEGHEGNPKDGIWKSLNEADRKLVTVPFTPIPKSRANELAAKLDVVMGVTPEA
jgi:protocatechuate 3,4-dioxygenase, beta subunit